MVFNCIGNGHRLDTVLTPPLLKRLVERRLAQPHPAGGFRVRFETSQVIGKSGETAGMFVVGDVCYGPLLATADCKQTVLQASRCVASIKEALRVIHIEKLQRSNSPDITVQATGIANQGIVLDFRAFLSKLPPTLSAQPPVVRQLENLGSTEPAKTVLTARIA